MKFGTNTVHLNNNTMIKIKKPFTNNWMAYNLILLSLKLFCNNSRPQWFNDLKIINLIFN